MKKNFVFCACSLIFVLQPSSAVVIQKNKSTANTNDNKEPDVSLFTVITAETEKPLKLAAIPMHRLGPTESHANGNQVNSLNEESDSFAQIKRKPDVDVGEAKYECFVGQVNLGEIKSFDEYFKKNCPKNVKPDLVQSPQTLAYQIFPSILPLPGYGAMAHPYPLYNQPTPNPIWNNLALNGLPSSLPRPFQTIPPPQYPYTIPTNNDFRRVTNVNDYNSQMAQAFYQNYQNNPQNYLSYPYYTGR